MPLHRHYRDFLRKHQMWETTRQNAELHVLLPTTQQTNFCCFLLVQGNMLCWHPASCRLLVWDSWWWYLAVSCLLCHVCRNLKRCELLHILPRLVLFLGSELTVSHRLGGDVWLWKKKKKRGKVCTISLVGCKVIFLLQLFHVCLVGFTFIFQKLSSLHPSSHIECLNIVLPFFVRVIHLFFVFLSRFLLWCCWEMPPSSLPPPHTALPL